MIIENEMLHGRLPRGAARRGNQPARRTRTVPRPLKSPGWAIQQAPEWQPGFGEWDINIRSYQASQAEGAAGAALPHQRRIAAETGIVPQTVAAAVCTEVEAWLGVPIPQPWRDELADYGEPIYQHNARFARSLRRGTGWGYLRAFMRHWVCAMLDSRRPDLAARLPSSYAIGHDLPPRQHSSPPPGLRRKSRPRTLNRRHRHPARHPHLRPLRHHRRRD
jgi:hypothetical protein